MTTFERVVQILDDAIGGANANIGVHGAFWRGKTRDQFVALKVLGKQLLVIGNGSQSNLIKALRGDAPFGSDLANPPAGATIPRMPDGLPPVTAADIGFISGWIDAGCPIDLGKMNGGANLKLAMAEGVQLEAVPIWKPTSAPTASSRYDDVFFTDTVNGWAVNSNGQILHTDDGGTSWTEQFHDPTVYMRCIAFGSRDRGWVGTITDGKTFFATDNAGLHWSAVDNLPVDAPVAICGIFAVSETVVYAAGSNHPEQPVRMMKTLDGGASWHAWDMRPWADNLIDVFFTSPERGWVVGGKTDDRMDPSKPKLRPVVLYTEDGGKTWEDRVQAIRSEFALGEWGWKIQFLNEDIGFISLQNYASGAILKTVDAGKTWRRYPINDPQMNANLEGIGFIDENVGWVGGWGDAPKKKRTSSATTDGGVTWRDANEIGRTINRFRFVGTPVSVGYAAGETVYKYSTEQPPALSSSTDVGAKDGTLIGSIRPQPNSGQTAIEIRVPEQTSRLAVRIFDPDGPLMRTLVDATHPQSGQRTLLWGRTDRTGNRMAAHSYIIRVTCDDVSESQLIYVQGTELEAIN